MQKTAIVCGLFIVLAFGCIRPPYYATNKVYKKQAKMFADTLKSNPAIIPVGDIAPASWVGTTNFNLRKPNFVIIHHTAQNSCDQTLKTFTLARTQVSAHYVICKDGTIHHMLNDYLRAWHGGAAKWGSLTDINSSSIGIELDNNGFETFGEPQLKSLLILLDTLKTRYKIPVNNFIGHADIAPTRKNDPNINFPWQTLAQKGFGSWYGDTSSLVLPETFNTVQALRIIGYDTKDSVAAVQAFKRHFLADSTMGLQEPGKKVLYDVMLKAM
ncbi:MAG: N-acetylmuramoyl-L-alanine amidase [Chitinophagaceae bacterium]|nr:N-acetylmuramoyl-L-alanine amidase [Chitinophagaceae bacterium]